MKEIEKLARESADGVDRTFSMSADGGYESHVDGFEAGFRKAREMAAKVAENQWLGEGADSIEELIRALGESEVS